MEQYIGTKIINATPLNKGEYNHYRGWSIPQNEDPNEEGYMVEYPESNPNTPDYTGYISWSPKEVFEKAYKSTDKMDIGSALSCVLKGYRITNPDLWKENSYIVVNQLQGFIINNDGKGYSEIEPKPTLTRISDRITKSPYTLSQEDIFRKDWMLVTEIQWSYANSEVLDQNF
jgi:hypothetical protein